MLKPGHIVCIAVLLLTLAACGPTAEQMATMTAAAWTPTPVPTPTATPIPYDLTVHVADESGAPIPGASIVAPDSGIDTPALTDASGQYTWTNLPGPTLSLTVSAPGFHEAVQALTLERGVSEMALVLQSDPFGLIPADACAPDETPLLIQDFQSGRYAPWHLNTPLEAAWAVRDLGDGNEVGVLSGVGITQVDLQDTFDNVVWRLKVQAAGARGQTLLSMRHLRQPVDSRYALQWGPTTRLALLRMDPTAAETVLFSGGFRPDSNVWYYVEFSYFQGQLQVWVDGRKEAEFLDTAPLAPGTISMESQIDGDPNMAYYLDNISVCDLRAPFAASMYKPPVQ